MKTRFYVVIATIAMLAVTMHSCNKDREFQEERAHPVNVPPASLFHEQVKISFSRWFAKTCNANPDFKKFLFTNIVDVNKGSSEELFLLDFIHRRYEGGTVKDAVIAANAMAEGEMDLVLSRMGQEFYNLVLDVPDFIAWFFDERYAEAGLRGNYHEKPFVFYPDISRRNANGRWTGFGQYAPEDAGYDVGEGLVLHEIGDRGVYREVIPIFLKQAELNYVIPANSRDSEAKEALIREKYGDVIESGKICIKEAMDAVASPITLGGTLYDRIDLIALKYATMGCDHRLPPMETEPVADTTIDPPLDEDPPQGGDPENACVCLRDCRADHNNLIRHAFDRVLAYYEVTSGNLPGVEKTITLHYDITRLNAPACPPGGGVCPFTTSLKIVFDRATMLNCDGYTGSLTSNEQATLCMSSLAEWQAKPTGFFYGAIVPFPNATFAGSEYISFATLNGYSALIFGCNFWVHDHVFYLPASADQYFADWDASVYGDMIRIRISETDTDQLSSQVGETQSYTLTSSFSGKVGSKITLGITIPTTPPIGLGGEFTSEYAYEFTSGQTRSVSNTFTVNAKNLVQLGDLDLRYCAPNTVNYQGNVIFPGQQSYHLIDQQSNLMNWWEIIIKQ